MRETFIRCGDPHLDALFDRTRNFLSKDTTEYNMFGRQVRGYRSPDSPAIWLRDYSDMMRAFKYWERDMKSVVDHIAETQTETGWLFDYFSMTPEKPPCEKENWAKYVRVPVEADVEYRFIKAAYLAWQATGDDRWLKRLLPNMERALHYILTDAWRWDKKRKLVKRAFTIDTWDFDYTAGRYPWLNFRIDDQTCWGIMHGDSSGYYEAFLLLSRLYECLGKRAQARRWSTYARAFRRRANAVSFNGTFYTHHVHLTPVAIDGVDEQQQLSLSNPMDINRGLATHAMAVMIIREYQRRGIASGAFAPWYSIDPPFPDGLFGDEKLVRGAYCNGGIMPLVGGELARAAFEHGFEEFGVEQLLRYEELTRQNESYLWYFPDGRKSTVETSTSPDASPTDGWGSSAMCYALVEGLAGVVDEGKTFRQVRLSPRWTAAARKTAEVQCVYGASGASFGYIYAHDPIRRTIDLETAGKAKVHLHLLLPKEITRCAVWVNGRPVRHRLTCVEKSMYVDSDYEMRDSASIRVTYSP